MNPIVSATSLYRPKQSPQWQTEAQERQAAHDAAMDAAARLTRAYSPALRDNSDALVFVPGQGYMPRREYAANHLMTVLDAAAGMPPVSEYEMLPGPVAGVIDTLDLAHGGVEGVLAGLSRPTDRSSGFVQPILQGTSGDPMDRAAVQDRLYRNRDGEPMGWLQRSVAGTMTDPVNLAFPADMVAWRGRPPTTAIRTELVDRHGDVIRRIRDARPAPRMGLPGPGY